MVKRNEEGAVGEAPFPRNDTENQQFLAKSRNTRYLSVLAEVKLAHDDERKRSRRPPMKRQKIF